MKLSRRSNRSKLSRLTERRVLVTCGVAGGVAAAGVAAAKNRRAMRRAAGGARGALHGAAASVTGGRSYDDHTLVRKVESEIFRAGDAPKGQVSVSAVDGVVELRGEVAMEHIATLGKAAQNVDGVREVRSLLHVPGTPAPHAPPSDPDDVRARAERHGD
jgi:osmotically-inducible protein OsmY